VRSQPAAAAAVTAVRPPSARNPLQRIEWVLDASALSRSKRAKLARTGVGMLFLTFGCLALAIGASHDDITLTPLLFVLGSIPVFLNRFGRFGRFFLPVILAMLAYGFVAEYVTRFKLAVHFTPQISIEEHLTPGAALPTVWLQEHLYSGRTGPLEILSVAAYASHFVVPLVLGAALAICGRSREFKLLMFGLLTVSVLGSITFLLAPTAPPWLAAQEGYLSGVQHILKQSLYDLHMTSIAAFEGDASKYDITAAVPSLHAAFPLISLLTVVSSRRLPRWVAGALGIQLLAVAFAIVYMGEHYVLDAIVGLAYAAVAWLAVRWLLGAEAEDQAADAGAEASAVLARRRVPRRRPLSAKGMGRPSLSRVSRTPRER
jgi:hypothetical protein